MQKKFLLIFITFLIIIFSSCTGDLPTANRVGGADDFKIIASPFTALGKVGTSISNYFVGSGGTPFKLTNGYTYNYSLTGTLPSGLINADTGDFGYSITGTPAAAEIGNFKYTLFVEDSVGFKYQKYYELDINLIDSCDNSSGWRNKIGTSSSSVKYKDTTHIKQGSYSTRVMPYMSQSDTNEESAIWYYIPVDNSSNYDFSSGTGYLSFYYYTTIDTDILVQLRDSSTNIWYSYETLKISNTWHQFKKQVVLGGGNFTDTSSGSFDNSDVHSIQVYLYQNGTDTQPYYTWPIWFDGVYIQK